METKFTPGPWTLGQIDAGTQQIDGLKVKHPWTGLASVVVAMEDGPHQYKSCEDGKANAHLIAAAPELYEALAGAVELMDARGWRTERERAILAKARGEQ